MSTDETWEARQATRLVEALERQQRAERKRMAWLTVGLVAVFVWRERQR